MSTGKDMRRRKKVDSSFLIDPLDCLREVDNLKEIPFPKCKCFLHNEHRWTLPLIHYAQEEKRLPRPCTLIMFDGHHDAREPTSIIDEICKIRELGVSFERLIYLCREKLSPNDDDWVRAGMELGLIGDAVIFGVRDTSDRLQLMTIKDCQEKMHRIELTGFPSGELGFQGNLSDLARRKELTPLWEILEWRYDPETKGFGFTKDSKRILLDFDLDCFVINWEEFAVPWLDEVFEKRFFTFSDYFTTYGWTGKRFLDDLVNRADLITIAREPNYCGGEEKADVILLKMNHYLFDDNLHIELAKAKGGEPLTFSAIGKRG